MGVTIGESRQYGRLNETYRDHALGSVNLDLFPSSDLLDTFMLGQIP